MTHGTSSTERANSIGPYAYRLVRRLGEGGMAVTFLAIPIGRGHRKMPRYVVIKVAKSNIESNKAEGSRSLDLLNEEHRNQGILNEERILKRLEYPNIPCLYRIRMWDGKERSEYAMRADWPGDPWFCVYEYINGQTLADRLGPNQTILSLFEILAILRKVLETLEYLHSKDIVHMDITPANIMLRRHYMASLRSPQPVLIDFGIACDTGQLSKGKTIRYMSPERRAGRVAAHPCMDIYALGLILYEMLTNRLPDSAQYESASVTRKKKYEIKLIQQFFDPLITKMIADEPAQRPSASTLIHELDKFALPWWRRLLA